MSCSIFYPVNGRDCIIPTFLLLPKWKKTLESLFIRPLIPWEKPPRGFSRLQLSLASPGRLRVVDSSLPSSQLLTLRWVPTTSSALVVVIPERPLQLVLKLLSEPKEICQPVTSLDGEVRDCFRVSCVSSSLLCLSLSQPPKSSF